MKRRDPLGARALAAFAFAGVLSAGAAPAEELPEWLERTRLGLVLFGDAYGVAESHRPELEGENGFWMRRINLTLDFEASEQLSARLRLEAASPGDFATNETLDPFVKDAWIRWRSGAGDLVVGLAPTPTWATVEDEWGYRAVEKTPLDLYRLGSSRDLGIAFRGGTDDERWSWSAMLGNGSSTGAETNEGKKVMGSVAFRPGERLTFELYADTENRPGETDRSTAHLFAGYRPEWGRVGALVARQRRETGGAEPLDLDVASVWAVWDAGERWSLLARYDRMLDPNPDGERVAYLPFSALAESSLVLLGWDYRVHESFQLVPNLAWIFYESPPAGPTPDDDLVLRLTFHFQI